MPAATNDGPSVALSCKCEGRVSNDNTCADRVTAVANNFWGKEDAGVGPLLERMHAAKQTSDELRAFYSSESHNSSHSSFRC